MQKERVKFEARGVTIHKGGKRKRKSKNAEERKA